MFFSGERPMQPPAGAIVGVGEVLWDLLPSGRQLGGAPLNFVFHCHQLGHAAVMVSRVGRDELGRDIRAALRERGLTDAFVQEDSDRPTGTVHVALGEGGQPEFTIVEDVAYDHLTPEPAWDALFGQAVAVCFGTLVQRDPGGRAAVQRALALARNALTVYDVNLRQHCYDRATVEASLRASRWVKMNDDELTVLRDFLQLRGKTPSVTLRDLRRRFAVELACVTRGERGCLVQTDDEEIAVPGQSVQVVDTVGAGDAFTAGLLVTTLEGRTLAEAATFANRLAGKVAASAGGTPVIDRKEIER
jgi:fructokinase